ncbi:hypothetical protein [Kineococcus indalonis]|uniref:hypothetical protein n=1 Tax=Kineococcus indalonis TaxID=2696566 RepID=UPI0014120941|nr:hypothetical protein [Kineococcus indalonis]NAZ85567.1 hypothetical protein [Kineococcus indalonis]
MSEQPAARGGAGPGGVPGAGAELAARAALLLRQHTDAGWVAVRESVVSRALHAFRPSAPVRGRHAAGDYFVASDVLVAALRRAVDLVPRVAATRITCTTGEDDELDDVVVELVAAYGVRLLEVAGQVHAVAREVLGDLLGPLAPAAERIRTHVHLGDVSDDPRVVG